MTTGAAGVFRRSGWARAAAADDGPGGDVAGVTWCLATRLADGRTTPVIYFCYHDLMRCNAQGNWRFASRYLRLRFRAQEGAGR